MADSKLSALTELTAPASVDIFAIVDDPAGTPVTKKVTLANLLGNVPSGQSLGWSNVKLFDDAANTLALRNGVNAQAFNIYNTYIDASNFERLKIGCVSNVFTIAPEAAGTGSQRPLKIFLHANKNSWIEDTNASGGGYIVNIRNRYGYNYYFGSTFVLPAPIALGDSTYGPRVHWGTRNSRPAPLLNASVPFGDMHLVGKYGGSYSIASGYHNGTGITAWCGYGATPTDINGNGGDAGNFTIWLNAGGAGNGTGNAGSNGRFRIIDDDTDTESFAIDKSGNVFAPNLPTSDPTVAGQVWNDAGTLKISAG